MMPNQKLDIIWNISLICPWDCEFCCTDAVHVKKDSSNIIMREHSLNNAIIVDKALEKLFHDMYPQTTPTKFDLALLSRQISGQEPTFEQKQIILNHLKGREVSIDFAGGDPLACFENFLIIRQASEIFGKSYISITSTGAFIKKYGPEMISEVIGEYEFTYDEATSSQEYARPAGYNISNLRNAKKFSNLGVRTKAQLPIHAGNTSPSQIKKIYNDLCAAGIDELLLMRTFPVGRGAKYLLNNSLSHDQVRDTIQHFKNAEQMGGTAIRLQCALKFLSETTSLNNPCDMMHESFGVNFRGDLLLSAWANNANGLPLSDDFVLGNLCNQSFDEISASAKFQRYKTRLDENFGHCKIFAYTSSEDKKEDSLFARNDPLYKKPFIA